MRNGTIINPSQVNVQARFQFGEAADSHQVVIDTDAGPQVFVFGGCTKTEKLASEIAAQLVRTGWTDTQLVAIKANDIAEAVLNESRRRDTDKRNAPNQA